MNAIANCYNVLVLYVVIALYSLLDHLSKRTNEYGRKFLELRISISGKQNLSSKPDYFY